MIGVLRRFSVPALSRDLIEDVVRNRVDKVHTLVGWLGPYEPARVMPGPDPGIQKFY